MSWRCRRFAETLALVATVSVTMGGSCSVGPICPTGGTGREGGRNSADAGTAECGAAIHDAGRGSTSSSSSSTSSSSTSSSSGAPSSSGSVSSSAGTAFSGSSSSSSTSGAPLQGCDRAPQQLVPQPTHALEVLNGSVVVGGPFNVVMTEDPVEWLVPSAGIIEPGVLAVAAFNGELVLARYNQLQVLGGEVVSTWSGRYAQNMVAAASSLVVPLPDALILANPHTGTGSTLRLPAVACLVPVVALQGDELWVASPEWDHGFRMVNGAWQSLPAHGAFDDSTAFNAGLWAVAPPGRVLLGGGQPTVEVASLGGHAVMMLHPLGGASVRVPLPDGDYCCGARMGQHAFLVDRGLGGDARVVAVTLDGATVPAEFDRFPGSPRGITAAGGRLYVVDTVTGVRVYSLGSFPPQLLGVVHP